MIYILFFGLVIAGSMVPVQAEVAKLFFLFAMASLLVTTIITLFWSKWVSADATFGDSLRSSMLFLIATGLNAIMTYQIFVKQIQSNQSPTLILLI